MTATKQAPVEKTVDVDVIDIKQLLATLLDNKKTILGTALLFFIIAVLYCLFRVPIYQTSALLNSNAGSSSSTGLSSVVSDALPSMLGGGQSTMQAQMEADLVESRSVLGPVIKSLNLDVVVEPDYFPIIGKGLAHRYDAKNYANHLASPVLGLSGFAWGGESIKVGEFNVSESLMTAESASNTFAIVNLGDKRYQLYDPSGDLLGTGVIGQKFVKNINQYTHVSLQINELKAPIGMKFTLQKLYVLEAIKLLSKQLSVHMVDKKTPLISLNFVGESPEKSALILNAIADQAVQQDIHRKSEQAAKTLAFLKTKIPGIEKQVYAAEKALNDYRAKSGNVSLKGETKILLQTIADTEAKIYDLKVKRAQLLQLFTDRSVQVEGVDTSIAALKAQLQSLNTRLKNLPVADQVAIGLVRDAKVQNQIYTNLMQKVQQFELLKAGTVGDLSVVDYANVPYKKANKPALLIIILAAFIGLFLSVTYVFIRKALFQGIDDPDVIENRYGLSVLGVLMTSKAQSKQMALLQKNKIKRLKLLPDLDPQDVTVEGLKSLRTNLNFELLEAKNNIINISGPCPNVGKTFVSVNLARVLSEAGKKVLLIDADLRRGTVHQYFGIDSRDNGFTDLLQGRITTEEAITKTEHDHLDLMTTGTLVNKHAELLMGDRLKSLLTDLSAAYDLVIIDTAPILAITDASLVAQHAGINMVVFADGKHDNKEIELTVQRFEKVGVKLSGFIFNNMQPSTHSLSNKYKYAYRYETQN